MNRVVKQCIYGDNSRSTTNDINHHFKLNKKYLGKEFLVTTQQAIHCVILPKKRVYQVQKKRKKTSNINTLEHIIRKVPKSSLEKPKRQYKKQSPNKKLFDDIVYDISPSMNYYSTTKQQRDDTLRLGMHHAEFFSPQFIDNDKTLPLVKKMQRFKQKRTLLFIADV